MLAIAMAEPLRGLAHGSNLNEPGDDVELGGSMQHFSLEAHAR